MAEQPAGAYMPEPTSEVEEYNDIPVSVAGGDAALKIRNDPPKGTTYGKKAISLLLIFLGAALGTVIIIGIIVSRPKSVQTQPTQESVQAPVNQDMTPEEFKQIPSSHGNGQTAQGIPTGQDGGQGQQTGSQQNPGAVGQSARAQTTGGYQPSQNSQYNTGRSTGYSNSVPRPPVLQTLDSNPAGYQTTQTGLTLEQQEMEQVKKSPLRFGNSMTSMTASNTGSGAKRNDEILNSLNNLDQMAAQLTKNNLTGATASGAGAVAATVSAEDKDQNLQDEKRNFAGQKNSNAFYAATTVIKKISPYEVKAGSMIPAVLVSGINSDLPGNIIAQVRENVYDTVAGRYLLIPQGTKVIGTYDSKVAYAQNRVLVVWTRLIFPNGNSLDLGNMSGADQSGYSGLHDKVNNHYGKLFMGVLLTSVLGATAEVANNSTSSNTTYGAYAAAGAAQSLQQVGEKLVDKNLNIQPTLEIRPGYRFNLFVDKDFILQPYTR